MIIFQHHCIHNTKINHFETIENGFQRRIKLKNEAVEHFRQPHFIRLFL